MYGPCTDKDAAAIAGYSLDIFQRVWAKLVSEEGMPPPHYNLKKDGLTRSSRRSWDRVALERWAERRRPPEYREAEHGDALAGERARLAHRLQRLEGKAA